MNRSLNEPKNQHASTDPAKQAAFYGRYSSDQQPQGSIADQLRNCRKQAAENGHVIPEELEFKDEAVSGTKRDQSALIALNAAVTAGGVNAIYFDSLRHLLRGSKIILPLLRDWVLNHDVRVISVEEGIDSDLASWELTVQVMAIFQQESEVLRTARRKRGGRMKAS